MGYTRPIFCLPASRRNKKIDITPCLAIAARVSILFASGFFSIPLAAQSGASPSYQIYSGFTALSNTFNGIPGARQPLLGWEASAVFPAWHHLRPKLDYWAYKGTNLDASQKAFFIMAGGEYEHYVRSERFFGEALFGDAGLNHSWGANGSLGSSASFSTQLGGGVDTRVNKRFAIRFEGNYLHTNFYLYQSASYPYPYRIPGLPNNFSRFSAGLVWTPRPKSPSDDTFSSSHHDHQPVESDLVYEAFNSFGHFHIFADSWWAELHTAGLEYDRNSWGRFIGARMDYSADILPVVILTQGSQTSAWGYPLTPNRENVPGLAISPVGLRMIWRDGKRVKPYYVIKGGMIGFTSKALSENATYENFTLQQTIGVQFKLHDRCDFRAGLLFFHFSNAFIVASNPGLDSITYNAGLVFHLEKQQSTR